MQIDEIEGLISRRVKEGTKLEYKRGEWLDDTEEGKFKLRKWVTSFANSAGGRLIIGVAEEEVNGERIPTEISPVDRAQLPDDPGKWVEDVLKNRIVPPLIPFPSIEVINVEDDGGIIIVIDTPQTVATLHKVLHRGKESYFHRHDFEVLKMDEWEVRAILWNRRPRPVLRLVPDDPCVTHAAGDVRDPSQVFIHVRLENLGLCIARAIQIGTITPSPPLSITFVQPRFGDVRWLFKNNRILLEGLAQRFSVPERISIDSVTAVDYLLHPYDSESIKLKVNVDEWKRYHSGHRTAYIGIYVLAEEMDPLTYSLCLTLRDGLVDAELTDWSEFADKALVGMG